RGGARERGRRGGLREGRRGPPGPKEKGRKRGRASCCDPTPRADAHGDPANIAGGAAEEIEAEQAWPGPAGGFERLREILERAERLAVSAKKNIAGQERCAGRRAAGLDLEN